MSFNQCVSCIKSFFLSLLKISPLTLGGVALTHTLSIFLLDVFPLYKWTSIVSPNVSQTLWYSLITTLNSLFLCFFILHSLGRKQGWTSLSFFKFFKTHFLEVVTAQLRILWVSSIWLLALILPGIIMYLRLAFAECVIFFTPHFYENRQIDPLDRSFKSLKSQKFVLFILFLLLLVAPPLIDSRFEHAHFLYEPTGRIVQILLYTLLSILTYSFIFFNFKRSDACPS